MEPYFVGIDIGTGSTKAIAITLTGANVASCQYYYEVNSPKPGWSEQDPEQIFGAFKKCLASMVKSNSTPPLAISLSCAMHSLICVDEKGKALYPMITWADSRSEEIALQLKQSANAESVYKTTGTPIHAMSPLCKIIWLRKHKTDLFNATFKFISIKEYIWFKLFNEFNVDYSIASATGLFDIVDLNWSTAACELAGIKPGMLSKPVNTNYLKNWSYSKLTGKVKHDWKTKFVIGASDGCCANKGSFITAGGVASLTIGTSGAVRITSNRPIYNFKSMTFNYLLDEKLFVCGGAVNNGGIALKWLISTFLSKKELKPKDYENAFNQIAGINAGSDGLIFLPYLYGERAPIWNTYTSAVYFNIKPEHTKAHFLRAGLEGICYALFDVLHSLEEASESIDHINISGGFINSNEWTKILADITNKKLSIVQTEDSSAMGAIFIAMELMGYDLKAFEKNSAKGRDILPNKLNHNIYQANFLIYKRIYDDLKSTMDFVNKQNL